MSPQVAAKVAELRERAAHMAGKRSAAALAWKEIPLRTRVVLVMLCCTQSGDARDLACQEWEQFSDNDRITLGASARELKRGLAGAERLR